jgi:peptidoglycan/LPS O-acetylase OafA/YrhL
MSATDAAPRSERGNRLAALTGMRAVAAFAVVATHAGFQSGRSLDNGPFAPLLARLNFGVTLFFCLSGFLLARPFLAKASTLAPGSVARFWWRRSLRVFPAYWIAVSVTLAFLTTHHASLDDWLSYLFMIDTFTHHYSITALSQMWTLPVELAFYLCLPLAIRLSRGVRGRSGPHVPALLITMAAIAVATNLLVHGLGSGSSPGLLWPPLYFDWFALGILLAWVNVDIDGVGARASRLREDLRAWSQSAGTCWIIGGLLFWLATLPLAGPRNVAPAGTWEWTIGHELYGAAAFFLLLPLTQGGALWQRQLLGNRVMCWLGEISYGVYLWHLALLLAIQRWIGWRVFTGHFFELLVLSSLAATGVAALSWHLIESPLLRRFSTSWRRIVPSQALVQDETHGAQAQQLQSGAAG